MMGKETAKGDRAMIRNGSGFWLTLLMSLFWSLASWVRSIPAWVALILHFTAGLSIWWFWGTLAAWILGTFFWLLIIRLSGRAGSAPETSHGNKNPYSAEQADVFRAPKK